MRIRFCAALFSGVGMEQVRGRYGACRMQSDVVFRHRPVFCVNENYSIFYLSLHIIHFKKYAHTISLIEHHLILSTIQLDSLVLIRYLHIHEYLYLIHLLLHEWICTYLFSIVQGSSFLICFYL